eukprot:gene1225-11315_t
MFSGENFELKISNTKLKHIVSELIQNYGGVVKNNSDYIISDQFSEEKDSFQIKYIYDCIKEDKKLKIEPYKNIEPVFSELKFSACSSFSIEEIEKLISLIEYYGGEYIGTENKSADYIICYEDENLDNFKDNRLVHYQFINDCIKYQKLLNFDEYKPPKPLSNFKTFFKNLKFYITGYLPEIKNQLEDNIKYLGGIVESKYSKNITHFVCLFQNCEHYDEAKNQKSIKIITGNYIDYCIQEKKILNIDSNPIFKPLKKKSIEEMKKYSISTSGFSGIEKNNLIFFIRAAGAKYSSNFGKNDTHLICSKNQNGQKLKAAKDWKIPALTVEWLIESILKGEKQNENNYSFLTNENKKRKNQEVDEKKKKIKKEYNFLLSKSLSGKNGNYVKIIENLNGKLIESEFDENVTHVIFKSCSRTKKFLLSLASGKWILKPEYLIACEKSKKCIDEENYEWNGDEIIEDKHIWLGCIQKWRKYYQTYGYGPFHNWECILIRPAVDEQLLNEIITTGGGEVVKNFSNKKNKKYVIADRYEDSEIKNYSKKKIPIKKGIFILDYLTLKEED